MELAQSLNAFSLLMVDDDKTARDVISRMIPNKFPNCTIYTADNGIMGMEIFRQFAPDIVVTDINMPVMEGLEMIREISVINPEVSFIVLTAYSEKVTSEKYKDLSVCSILLKPIDLKDLFAAIEKCRAERTAQEE